MSKPAATDEKSTADAVKALDTTMHDRKMRDLGRRVMRATANQTEPGRFAIAIGNILYDGVYTGRSKGNSSEQVTLVAQLTAIQGYLEELARVEAEKIVEDKYR